MKEQLRATEEEFAAKTEMLRDAEQALTDKQAELGKINHELSDRSMTADSRQIELVAVRTQIEAIEGPRRRRREGICRDAGAARAGAHANPENATRELAEARSRVENLSQRVTDLDRQLIVQVKEAEMLGTRVNDLETRLATQGKLLAEREYENDQLKQTNASRRAHHRGIAHRDRDAVERRQCRRRSRNCAAEKAAVEEQLRVARDERAKLQRDINAIQQQAESSWATERMENALLRERINDIAAEVAKLAIQLEGPNSAIEAMLAAEPATPAESAAKPANDVAGTAADGGACPKAAARSPNASAPCNPTPPAPASRARNSSDYQRIDRCDTTAPHFVNRGLWA